MNNKRKQLIVKIVAHLVLLLGAITMLVPFIWMLSSSVKSLGEVFVFPPTLFGEKIVWENYTKISSRFDYLAYFLNSVKVSAWVVIFQVFTSATAGYVFAKLNFKGRDRIFTLYLATMMIPFHVTVITNFLQMSMYGLVNTLWSLMLPASVSAFGTFLMRQFFVTVPNELIEAAKAAAELGYPVLVRPSYVLGGQGMEIAYDEKHIREYMSIINMNVQEHPILVDKYLLGREIEVDAICDGENVLIPGIMEHVERAGIHSGDSISVYPPQHLAPRIQRMVTDYTINIARSLHVRGLVNIQFIEYAGDLYIIEVNPRSSRTVPYISKVTGIPIVELGVRASLGEKVPEMGFGTGLYPPAPTVAVKMPVFSFEKLPEVEVSLGPEMKSTGEALGLAETAEEAYLKGFASTKMAIPKPEEGGVLFSIADHDKREALELAETFAALGFEIYATTGTAHRLNHHYVGAQPVPRPGEDTDKLAKLFDSGKIRLIIATPTHGRDPMRAGFRLRRMAVEYGIACVTSIDTAKLLMKCVKLGKKAEDVPPLGLHDLIL